MDFSWNQFFSILNKNKECILATIIDKRGSAPRGIGTSMTILKDGKFYGTIGGGPIEAKIIQIAAKLCSDKKSAIKEFTFTGEEVICGGLIKVLFEYFSEKDFSIIEEIIKNINNGNDQWLIYNLNTFEKKLFTSENIDEKLFQVIKDSKQKSFIFEGLFIQYIEAAPELHIFGGGHIAVPLVKIANLCGFFIIVYDDRKDYATKERFPEADKVIFCDFNNVKDKINFHNNVYFVLITREHAHDEILLKQLLGNSYRYLGMIGSKKRVGSVKKRVIEEGFNEKEVNNIYSPIGLDINSETPAEIAVSIIAEIIKVKNSKGN